jgi:hypothetical protein
VLEDLHWSDRSSLELLAFVAHGLRESPTLLVATYRSDELHRRHRLRPLLADLDRNPAVERFELRCLSRVELAELLAARLGREPDPNLVERVMVRSEGNPLFAEELLASELHGGARRCRAASRTCSTPASRRCRTMPGRCSGWPRRRPRGPSRVARGRQPPRPARTPSRRRRSGSA